MMKILFAGMALTLFRTDLAVKQEIEELPENSGEHRLPGGFAGIQRLHNYGLAGGRWTGHMTGIVRGTALVTGGCIAFFLRLLTKPGQSVRTMGVALLTGGALSNLYDRCRRGYVVDYIRFHTPFKWLNRLVFNLADFLIFIGAFLVCLGNGGHSQG
ncbi:MAG: signal peptidase II [Lachnospiraceae bacterium]|nr:signal peptidase II [Lachnospiraceae bacterium]